MYLYIVTRIVNHIETCVKCDSREKTTVYILYFTFVVVEMATVKVYIVRKKCAECGIRSSANKKRNTIVKNKNKVCIEWAKCFGPELGHLTHSVALLVGRSCGLMVRLPFVAWSCDQ